MTYEVLADPARLTAAAQTLGELSTRFGGAVTAFGTSEAEQVTHDQALPDDAARIEYQQLFTNINAAVAALASTIGKFDLGGSGVPLHDPVRVAIDKQHYLAGRANTLFGRTYGRPGDAVTIPVTSASPQDMTVGSTQTPPRLTTVEPGSAAVASGADLNAADVATLPKNEAVGRVVSSSAWGVVDLPAGNPPGPPAGLTT